jgi:hypothetical protein
MKDGISLRPRARRGAPRSGSSGQAGAAPPRAGARPRGEAVAPRGRPRRRPRSRRGAACSSGTRTLPHLKCAPLRRPGVATDPRFCSHAASSEDWRTSQSGYTPGSGAVSSVGRAPARQAGGHWFEPSTAHADPSIRAAARMDAGVMCVRGSRERAWRAYPGAVPRGGRSRTYGSVLSSSAPRRG